MMGIVMPLMSALEGICTDGAAGDLTGDRHHRHRVHVGIGNRCHQVGGARARRGHTHADLAWRSTRSPSAA